MATVVDKGVKRDHKDGRAVVKKEKKEDKETTQLLANGFCFSGDSDYNIRPVFLAP